MSTQTNDEVPSKLRRRHLTAGRKHKKLIDEAVGLLGYHRKAAIRALRLRAPAARTGVQTGRPEEYDAVGLRPVLRTIWSAASHPNGIYAPKPGVARHELPTVNHRPGKSAILKGLTSIQFPSTTGEPYVLPALPT